MCANPKLYSRASCISPFTFGAVRLLCRWVARASVESRATELGTVLRAGRFVCDCVRLKIPCQSLEGARVIRMRQVSGVSQMEVSDAKPIRMLTFESTRYPFLFLRFVPLIHLVVGEQDTKGFADQVLA